MSFGTTRQISGRCGTQPSGTHPDVSNGEIMSQSHLDEGWRRRVHLHSSLLLPVAVSQISPDRRLTSLHFCLMRPLRAQLLTPECGISFKSWKRTQMLWMRGWLAYMVEPHTLKQSCLFSKPVSKGFWHNSRGIQIRTHMDYGIFVNQDYFQCNKAMIFSVHLHQHHR